MSETGSVEATSRRVRNVAMSGAAWDALLNLDDTEVVETDGGEMALVLLDGQLHLHFAFESPAVMQRAFVPLFEPLRETVEDFGVDYVRCDLAEVSTRRLFDPLLHGADFTLHGEWMEMLLRDAGELEPPTIPDGLEMRRATDGDAAAIVAIEQEAYGDWSDEATSTALRLAEAGWVGVLTESGSPIAYAINSDVEDAEGRILSAAVDPDHRGAGLGQIILGAAAYQLGAGGARVVSVRARPDIPESARTASALGFAVGRRAVEYRRPADEELVEERRERLRVEGMKVRFGDWR